MPTEEHINSVGLLPPEETPADVVLTSAETFEVKKRKLVFPTGMLPEGCTDSELIKRYFEHCVVGDIPSRRVGPSELTGCGQSALAFLTCNSLVSVHTALPDKLLTDAQMLGYLRARGYIVQPLLESILQPEKNVINDYIQPENIVLMRVNATVTQTSWIVLWNNQWVHNFVGKRAESTTFINMSIVSRYVVFHPTRYKRKESASSLFNTWNDVYRNRQFALNADDAPEEEN